MSAVLTLDPLTVDPSEVSRIGLFYPAKAEALGVLMKRDGQNDPIKVVAHKLSDTVQWRLVAGLHRLQGAIAAGIDVKAIEESGDATRLREIQASENMHRRELEPLERAMFVQAVAEAAKARVLAEHGVDNEQALGGFAKADRKQYHDWEKADEMADAARSNLDRAYGWRDEVSESLGLSLSDLKRSMRIYRCICEPFSDLIDKLKDAPIAKVADNLNKIAVMRDVAARRKLIETIVDKPWLSTLQSAERMAGMAATPSNELMPYQKYAATMSASARRIGVGEWRKVCDGFVGTLRPGQKTELLASLQEHLADNPFGEDGDD